ncbi:MAG: hypothetical protein HY020_20910 [Burkholderiales bacterium]|nr:hypothetical protein [Burkholderiales bacterium]
MRRAFKVLLWVVLGPLGLLLLVALAWVGFNGRWADAAPQPVPPELLPRAVTLAPPDNAFFDGQGLRAPIGVAPNDWGQRAWRGETDKAAELLTLPAGDAWRCNSTRDDCVARWRGMAADLRAQMRSASLFGERCRALAGDMAFQEPWPPRRETRPGDEPGPAWVFPQWAPLGTCVSWLQIEGVLASDAAEAAQAFARADALLRLLAGGSQTLISQAITWNKVQRHHLLLAQWSAGQSADTRWPAGWMAPMPARLLEPRLWMAAEFGFQRAMIADIQHGGEQLFDREPNLLQRWAGRWSLGFLPEATLQTLDANWLANIHAMGGLQGVALAHQARVAAPVENPLFGFLHWRNPFGQVLLDVARPQYQSFSLRQADLAVSQVAFQFSQQLNDVPARDRAGWWARQPLPAELRERLVLEPDALVALSWRAEVDPKEPARLRFPLRPG